MRSHVTPPADSRALDSRLGATGGASKVSRSHGRSGDQHPWIRHLFSQIHRERLPLGGDGQGRHDRGRRQGSGPVSRSLGAGAASMKPWNGSVRSNE